MVGFAQSKTANILFSIGLNARLARHGVHSFALHPGTGICRGMLAHKTDLKPGVVLSEGGKPMLAELPEHVREKFSLSFKTIDQGASTYIVAAFDPKLEHAAGVYLADCQQVPVAKPWATNPQQAEKLWELSEQLVGQQLQI